MGLSRVELFERIRRDRRLEPDVSERELARRHRVNRRTVKQALASPVPPPRKQMVPRRVLLEPAMGWIDAMLRADLTAPRKQRHTIRRIYDRLRTEYDFTTASYSTLRDYINRRRPEIVADAIEGHRHLAGMVPQDHPAGAEGEVDFADVWVNLSGVVTKCHMFTLRLSFSGRSIHRVFASQSQESFMQGHIEAFRALGGVPTRHIRYDNLKPAVKKVCFGRDREESARWVAFRSFYGYDAFYCRPGQEGAHEKGGVEHEGGRFRRNHLVPPPSVDSLDELNERIVEIERAEDALRCIHPSLTTVAFNFATEADSLARLPAEDFEYGLVLHPKVSTSARITVRQCRYSVPARFIGGRVRVVLRASDLLVFHGRTVIATHPRLTRRGDYHDVLDHYLEILLVKPGAMPGSTALAQARAEGVFTTVHDAFWSAATARHGQAEGTRLLIEVLLLHRRMDAEDVIAGLAAANRAGATSPEVVAVEARKHATVASAAEGFRLDADELADTVIIPVCRPDDPSEQADPGRERGQSATVISFPPRPNYPLPPDPRPLPSLARYNQLLPLHRKGGA